MMDEVLLSINVMEMEQFAFGYSPTLMEANEWDGKICDPTFM